MEDLSKTVEVSKNFDVNLAMRKVSRFIFLLPLTTFAFVLACESYTRDDINALIETDHPNNLVKAFYLIGENRDSLYVPIILANANDPRIAHIMEFKGNSVYQSKMVALKKISGLDSPLKITYKPDSTIIRFYSDWARKSGLLNNDTLQSEDCSCEGYKSRQRTPPTAGRLVPVEGVTNKFYEINYRIVIANWYCQFFLQQS